MDDLIMAILEKKDFLNQLESLITLSVRYSCLLRIWLLLVRFDSKYYTRLIREEIANVDSMQNIDKFVNILEEFVFNLNEIHTSSDKIFLLYLL
jgi:hypothetical protein